MKLVVLSLRLDLLFWESPVWGVPFAVSGVFGESQLCELCSAWFLSREWMPLLLDGCLLSHILSFFFVSFHSISQICHFSYSGTCQEL